MPGSPTKALRKSKSRYEVDWINRPPENEEGGAPLPRQRTPVARKAAGKFRLKRLEVDQPFPKYTAYSDTDDTVTADSGPEQDIEVEFEKGKMHFIE